MYPFKVIGNNVNRKLIGVALPYVNAQQLASKAVPGVANNYRGVWSSTSRAGEGDIFLYGSTMWLALAPSQGIAPATNTPQWQALGSYSAYRGPWSAVIDYVAGDEVTEGGNFWLALQGSLNQTPTSGSAYWQIAGPASLDNVADGTTYTRTQAAVQTGNVPDLSKGILGKVLTNIADDANYSKIQTAEITSNQWDPSKAGNTNAQTQYLSAVTGNQKNMVPDSDIKFNWVYWTANGSISINKGPTYGSDCGTGANNDNVFEYIGNGTPSAYQYARSTPFNVNTGQNVTLSANCYSASITAGSVFCGLYLWTGSALGTEIASISWNAAQSGTRPSATATIPSGYNQAVVIFDTNNATVTNGDAVLWQHPQVETGSVMTAYRSTDDQNGYSTYSGSGPVTSPLSYFSYTSTTSSIDWSWLGMGWYNADFTETTISNGSQNTTSLAASATYYFYPYDDLTAAPAMSWVADGGAGTPAIAHGAKYPVIVAQQNMASRIPLSNGGMAASTPASGSGGGAGGGNKCLHPDMQICVRDSFTYDKDAAEKTLKASELIAGRHALLTPDGWVVIRQHRQAVQHDWIELTLSNEEIATVTPSHILQTAGGDSICARDLKLGTILQADGALVTVIGMRAIYEPSVTVILDVLGHWFFANQCGVKHHNGTQKP
ncbi:MAG: hypothetical protein ACYDB1_01235 [Acidiferrobacteraceae bacterium]